MSGFGAEDAWLAEFVARAVGSSAADVRLEARQDWFNSVVYVCGVGESRSVAVKRGRGWSTETAERLHRDAVELAARLGSVSGSCFVAPPLGCWADPPAICSEFVVGQDGAVLAAEKLRQDAAPDAELVTACRLWGAAIAAYHRASEVDLVARDRDEARRHVKRIAGLLGRSRKSFSALRPQDDCARSLIDVGLHNVRLTPDGRACIFDLPTERLFAPVHYDVAQALGWLDDALRDAPVARRPSLRRPLRSAVLAGYSAGASRPLTGAGDRRLIGLYLTWCHLQWARTAAKRRHWADAIVRLVKGVAGATGLTRP